METTGQPQAPFVSLWKGPVVTTGMQLDAPQEPIKTKKKSTLLSSTKVFSKENCSNA